MTAGLVSVIIPSFNGELHLAQALESVLWQTYTQWEVIIVDDGSADGTASVAREYCKRDGRFRYERQENRGPAVARNKGIDLARGEFIQFLDDDDILTPDRLEECIAYLHSQPEIDVVYTDYVCHRQTGGFSRGLPARVPREDTFLAMVFELNQTFAILTHSLLFRRHVFAKERFDESYRLRGEDVECWTRLAGNGVRFGYLDRVHAIYCFRPDSLASDETLLIREKIRLLERYEKHRAVSLHRNEYHASMAYLRERLAIAYFMKKEFREGTRLMRQQWRLSGRHGRMKMIGWLFLMVLFSRPTIVALRDWLLEHTPLRWGGWREYQQWNPPDSVRQLLGV